MESLECDQYAFILDPLWDWEPVKRRQNRGDMVILSDFTDNHINHLKVWMEGNSHFQTVAFQ